ncbi:MAG TPA: hypothetical protein PKE65_06240, partial [Rhizobiaceae bacterium]|nr:hypothetical protein [Rhizobiaceae bacterium]
MESRQPFAAARVGSDRNRKHGEKDNGFRACEGFFGGAEESFTPGLLNAIEALSQLERCSNKLEQFGGRDFSF